MSKLYVDKELVKGFSAPILSNTDVEIDDVVRNENGVIVSTENSQKYININTNSLFYSFEQIANKIDNEFVEFFDEIDEEKQNLLAEIESLNQTIEDLSVSSINTDGDKLLNLTGNSGKIVDISNNSEKIVVTETTSGNDNTDISNLNLDDSNQQNLSVGPDSAGRLV